jgi:hypothetical protein
MEINTIRDLQPGTKIIDNRTGEVLKYLSYPVESQYVICSDENKKSIWLPPERIDLWI